MRVRTSITLPKELLIEVDSLVKKKHNRSDIIESALREYVAKERRGGLNKHDIEIINKNADLINKQVEETLEFQAEW